jgi:hypothetical protein
MGPAYPSVFPGRISFRGEAIDPRRLPEKGMGGVVVEVARGKRKGRFYEKGTVDHLSLDQLKILNA